MAVSPTIINRADELTDVEQKRIDRSLESLAKRLDKFANPEIDLTIDESKPAGFGRCDDSRCCSVCATRHCARPKPLARPITRSSWRVTISRSSWSEPSPNFAELIPMARRAGEIPNTCGRRTRPTIHGRGRGILRR